MEQVWRNSFQTKALPISTVSPSRTTEHSAVCSLQPGMVAIVRWPADPHHSTGQRNLWPEREWVGASIFLPFSGLRIQWLHALRGARAPGPSATAHAERLCEKKNTPGGLVWFVLSGPTWCIHKIASQRRKLRALGRRRGQGWRHRQSCSSLC
jgi:hypothetical protein